MGTSAAASRRTLRSNEYTVGLITALSKKSIAVTAIVDEEHDEPFDCEIPEDNYKNYGWGRIHQHNFVVVSFPMNSPRKVTAAVVARLMVTAFPSIRMGLMVGIGGGVPGEPRPDIRLGDIVVSAPVGTTFGVVQYDLGKEEERDGKERFRRTGALCEPPRALLTAVDKLKEQRRLHRTKVSRIIAETLEKYPQLEEEDEDDSSYRYPGFENDVLFCADSTATIEKKKRPKDEPGIHYSLIASGDSVIKNAQKRDEIAGRLKEDTDAACLCFEMNFPCLVVRVICDYSDSHKNDVWQNYAALAAAAYAKEVLRVLQAAHVKSTKDAREVMGEVQQHVQETQSTVSKLEEENLMKQIRTWLD